MHSLSRPSIDIEDTTTSTGLLRFKVLWSQILSLLLNLWTPPLLTIGTWETQGLGETMTLLCSLLGGCVSVRPIPCPALCLWHANGSSAVRFSSQAYRTKKRHILARRTCSAANMAAPTDS